MGVFLKVFGVLFMIVGIVGMTLTIGGSDFFANYNIFIAKSGPLMMGGIVVSLFILFFGAMMYCVGSTYEISKRILSKMQ